MSIFLGIQAVSTSALYCFWNAKGIEREILGQNLILAGFWDVQTGGRAFTKFFSGDFHRKKPLCRREPGCWWKTFFVCRHIFVHKDLVSVLASADFSPKIARSHSVLLIKLHIPHFWYILRSIFALICQSFTLVQESFEIWQTLSEQLGCRMRIFFVPPNIFKYFRAPKKFSEIVLPPKSNTTMLVKLWKSGLEFIFCKRLKFDPVHWHDLKLSKVAVFHGNSYAIFQILRFFTVFLTHRSEKMQSSWFPYWDPKRAKITIFLEMQKKSLKIKK